ncbi:MAG: NAD(P)/FAD-dependent oxidoreductase [Saprospiraceae bacterium]|nr:NAD(P)/FAD-dependent oxidoreductase [Saprospiraceae bacterium]
MKHADIIIIGGGAAGFFAAITAASVKPDLSIIILEQSKEVLQKVRISGGGRCNATHACFDPKELINFYPRGAKELLGPFYSFGPSQTIEWFKNHGVSLKTETDGRMFPVTDSSETILNCFSDLTKKMGIKVFTNVKVKNYHYKQSAELKFEIITDSENYTCNQMMLATGSSPFIWNLLKTQGYHVIEPVPSLFTFNLPKHPICNLMGLSVPKAKVYIKDTKISSDGPLLITHWGLSGPAVLKASAWGAGVLAERKYEFDILVDWVPDINVPAINQLREEMAKKKVVSNPLFSIPSRLWQFITNNIITDREKNWASLSKMEMTDMINQLKSSSFSVKGKTTFKEEFVTAGGVSLEQINFRSFQSKLQPGLFLAGEVLNIDALTGGFNFQAAWTGGYLAGTEMGKKQE